MINLNNVLKKLTDKPIYYGLIAIFLTIYGPRLHPKLPDGIRELFNNNIFRFAIITLIIYLSNRDLQLALIIALTFIIIMRITKMIMKKIMNKRTNQKIIMTINLIIRKIKISKTKL